MKPTAKKQFPVPLRRKNTNEVFFPVWFIHVSNNETEMKITRTRAIRKENQVYLKGVKSCEDKRMSHIKAPKEQIQEKIVIIAA